MRQIRSRLWVSEEGEGLVEPRPQHIHAVVSILDHGIPLFVTQLTTADTGWTDEERNAMIQNGYDGMDILRAWLD